MRHWDSLLPCHFFCLILAQKTAWSNGFNAARVTTLLVDVWPIQETQICGKSHWSFSPKDLKESKWKMKSSNLFHLGLGEGLMSGLRNCYEIDEIGIGITDSILWVGEGWAWVSGPGRGRWASFARGSTSRRSVKTSPIYDHHLTSKIWSHTTGTEDKKMCGGWSDAVWFVSIIIWVRNRKNGKFTFKMVSFPPSIPWQKTILVVRERLFWDWIYHFWK